MQLEITDYKNRLSRLEAEFSSSKPTVEEPTAKVIRPPITKQPSKRGRPKRPVASVDSLPPPNESHPRGRGRKPASSKVQSETKAQAFEKVIPNKVEDKEKTSHSIANIEQGNSENITSTGLDAGANVEISGSHLMMPVYHNHISHELPRVEMYEIGLSSSPDIKSNDDKAMNSKNAFSILSPEAKEMNNKGSCAAYMGSTANGNLEWPANSTSEESGRSMLSQCFYNNGNVIRQGGKIIPGWSFTNEDDASEELEDTVLGSAKDEDETMGEDASLDAEEIAGTRGEGDYNGDAALRSSPKGLPPLNNW